jgi:hypothetical protein
LERGDMVDNMIKPRRNMKDAILEVLSKYDGFTIYADESIEHEIKTIGANNLTEEIAEAIVSFITESTKEDIRKSLLGR